jgi:hypothetical protein
MGTSVFQGIGREHPTQNTADVQIGAVKFVNAACSGFGRQQFERQVPSVASCLGRSTWRKRRFFAARLSKNPHYVNANGNRLAKGDPNTVGGAHLAKRSHQMPPVAGMLERE